MTVKDIEPEQLLEPEKVEAMTRTIALEFGLEDCKAERFADVTQAIWAKMVGLMKIEKGKDEAQSVSE